MKKPFYEYLLLKCGKKTRRVSRLLALLALLAALAYIWSSMVPWVRAWQARRDVAKEKGLSVHFINVSHGDCILVNCDGHYMIIDSGSLTKRAAARKWEAARKRVSAYLRGQGIAFFDYIVATHEHDDHVSFLSDVACNYPFARVLAPLAFVDKRSNCSFNKFAHLVDSKGQAIEIPKLGEQFSLGDAVLTVLGPSKSKYDEDSENNHSLVLRLVYGDHSFLFMGDAQFEGEEDVLTYAQEQGLDLSTTVLKVGHHGACNASKPELLAQVRPAYAVVSCDSPKKPTYFDRLYKRLYKCNPEVNIYRTDKAGTIVFRSNKHKLQVYTEK